MEVFFMNGFWKRKLPAFVLAFVLVAGLIPAALADDNCANADDGKHQWGDWVISKEPTCSEEGTEVRTCKHCGAPDTQTQVVPPTERHVYTVISNDATCGEDGTLVRRCSQCGVESSEFSPKTGKHKWKDVGNPNPAATCTMGGVQAQVCEACGETQNATLQALGHTAPDAQGKCTRCGLQIAAAPSGITVTFKNGSANFNAQSNIATGGRPADPGKPSYPSPATNCTYTFKGWTTANPGAKAIYTGQSLTAATAAVNASTTYYAVYSVSAKSQNVSVNAGKSASVVGGSILTQINNKFSSLTGGNLTSVTFSSPAASSYGTLYANRNRKALGSIAYTYSGGSYPVSNLYFIPGRTSGYTVRYTAKDAYSTVAGTLSLPTAGTSVPDTADIVYQVAPGGTVNFKSSKFQDAYKKLSGGDTDIRYVTFHPDGDYDSFGGALYVGGRAIKGNQLEEKTFYTSNRRYGDHDLNTVSFRASKNAKVGAELVMEFYVHYDEDLYYEGTLRIVISKDDENGDVIYRVAPGGTVDFDRADFNIRPMLLPVK